MTSSTPADWAGRVAVIEVSSLLTVTFVAATPPTYTSVCPAPWKPVPVMVTVVGPNVGPMSGVTADTVGYSTAASDGSR